MYTREQVIRATIGNVDSLELRLGLLEFSANVRRILGFDIQDKDLPLYEKLLSDAVDHAHKHTAWSIATSNYLKGLRYINTDNLVPLVHPDIKGLYRVPVKVTKERYRIYTGKGTSRLFKGETMPPHILSKIVMANSVSKHYATDKNIYEFDLYICRLGEEMSDVAWRASESLYIVVLSEQELLDLKGNTK